MRKPEQVDKGIVSGDQTQAEIDEDMKKLTEKHSGVFKGLGKAKFPPVEVKVDISVKPKQQKLRRIVRHLKPKVKEYLEEMEQHRVVTKLPASTEHATGWISNLVITKKKWDSNEI